MQRAAALAAALALSATPLRAQGQMGHGMGQMGGMMRGGDMMGDMADMMGIHAYDPSQLLEKKTDLVLTANQVAKLEGLVQDVNAALAKAKTEHDAHHALVSSQFQQAVPDAAQVSQHVKAAMAAMAEGHAVEMAAMAKSKGLLTAEQRTKAEAWWADHEKMMKEHGMDEHRQE